MKWRAVAGVALRQYYLLRGSPIRLVPVFIWGAIDIVLWGFITRYLNTVGGSHIDFVPQLLGGVLFWDFSTRIMMGVTVAFLEDVWARNFLNLFASRLLISEYLLGLVLTSIATGLLSLAVMMALTVLLFGLNLLSFAALIAPMLMVLFLFGTALGIIATAIMLRFGPASEWIVWPIPVLVAPFVGVFYPVSTLPAWMQTIAHLLPPSAVFELLRSAASGHVVHLPALLWPAALGLAQTIASAMLFTYLYRGVVRSGLLARYSAEGSSA